MFKLYSLKQPGSKPSDPNKCEFAACLDVYVAPLPEAQKILSLTLVTFVTHSIPSYCLTVLLCAFIPLDFNPLDGEDGIPYQFRINGVTISYEDLQPEYLKFHRKIPKRLKIPEDKASWMRVKDRNIRIAIEANGIDCSNGMCIAKVVVQRERAAYEEVKSFHFTFVLLELLFPMDFSYVSI